MSDSTDQNPLRNPTVKYGITITNVLLSLGVAFLFLGGLIRWIVVGIAAIEAIVLPRILSAAAESADSEDDLDEFGESSEY